MDPSASTASLGLPLSLAVTEAVAAFVDDDPAPLSDHLRGLGVDVERLWRLPRWNVDPDHEAEQEDDPSPDKALEFAIRRVLGELGGGALLALHVWQLCAEEWEHTYRFDRLLATLESIAAVWDRLRGQDADPDSRAAGDGAAAFARLQILEVESEAAMCRGDLDRFAEAAAATWHFAEAMTALLDAIGDRLAIVRDFLRESVEARLVYYRALHWAVASAAAFLEDGADTLGAGLHALNEAEHDPRLSSIERSELRAHRFSLERLAAAAEEEWLTVDAADIAYVFPFGLNGIGPMDAVGQLRAAPLPPSIAGIAARTVRRTFRIDDVWAGASYLERRFDGAALELPEVRLLHADGTPIIEFAAEIRLSLLGNHYLRLTGSVSEADPHEIQSTLFRAQRGHGAIVVACGEGERRWERLGDFVADLQDGIADLLDSPEEVCARPGRYHVLVAVHELSAGTGPGARQRRPVTGGDDLLSLFGAQALLHPIPNGIGAICDWSRFAIDRSRLLRDVRKDGDLVAASENTTVIALFGSPEFMTGTYRTLAEFVGSLDGLFSAWHDRLASHHPRVLHLIGESTDERSAEALARYGDRLHREQLLLHDFATETRSVLSLIHSPNLVSSPTDAAALARLLRAAEIEQQELEFATKLRELLSDRLEVRIDAMAAKLQQRMEADRARQERFNRGIVDALLAAIAVFGASGIVQILQGAGISGKGFAGWAVAAIVVMAAVCSVAVFRWSRAAGASKRRRAVRDRPRRSRFALRGPRRADPRPAAATRRPAWPRSPRSAGETQA
ncbi:hypothetical protein [Glycomyces sp. NRRL B-16210]|uniref:hypothetical protein n=1 Tax=Glycomyces sp. NRRL B-16210 TaxID=1463821 RepID=UPI001061514B|nr:hypothetical protein [Glycomyces sp. NRRL B-16210]